MLKSVNTTILSEVGKSASFLLNQLYLWSVSKNTTVIFRTNENLVADLDHVIGVRTLARAKKTLIDKGYITTSFDKGRFRATHYTLTQKTLDLFASEKQKSLDLKNNKSITVKQADVVENNTTPETQDETFDSEQYLGGTLNDKEEMVQSTIEDETSLETPVFEAVDNVVNFDNSSAKQTKASWLPKEQYKKMMQDKRKQDENNKEMVVSESMKQSFNEGFSGNGNATKGIPSHLLTNPRLARMIKSKTNNSVNNVVNNLGGYA